MPSMALAGFNSSERVVSSSSSTGSNRPPFAAQQEMYRVAASVPRERAEAASRFFRRAVVGAGPRAPAHLPFFGGREGGRTGAGTRHGEGKEGGGAGRCCGGRRVCLRCFFTQPSREGGPGAVVVPPPFRPPLGRGAST